ncbi:hypothetical protein JCM17960_08060 [Magnetospira thiophila]
MRPRFDYGDAVRVIRSLRDDGTFPGKNPGDLLIRRGAVGFVKDVGTFLQDQIVYSVQFLDDNIMVGCREEELIGADDPWVPSLFEFRDKVTPKIPLGVDGEVVADIQTVGEILKVLRDAPGGMTYHVRFPGRTFVVPESALQAAPTGARMGDEVDLERETAS